METKPHPTLEEVKSQFTTWRANRANKKSPIPDNLWEAAVTLTDRYSLHKISKTLHVNHTALRDQVALRKTSNSTACLEPASFIELAHPLPPFQSECLIEMENTHGEKMRMHFTGEVSLDLMALSNNFWSNRP